MINYFHRKYILFLYIFSNVYLSYYFIKTGTLGGDFKHFFKTDPYIMSYSLASVLLSLVFFCILFSLCSKVSFKIGLKYVESYILDIIILSITVLYMINTSIYSTGIAGVSVDDSGGNKFNFYFLSIFQPVYLIAIYLFYRIGNRNYFFNVILVLYLITNIISGQSAQLMWMGFLYLLYRYNIKKRSGYTQIIFLSLVILLVSPFIRMAKFIFMQHAISGSNSLLTTANNYILSYGNYLEAYFIFFNRTVERFQQVANVQYIFENWFQLTELLIANDYIPTFVNHWLIKFLIKVFHGDLSGNETIQSILAYHINGLTDWSTQIGFVGYIPLLGLSFIGVFAIIIALVFASVILSKVIDVNKTYIVELTWLLMVMFLFHGWFVPFLNYFQALVFFITLIFTIRVSLDLMLYTRDH
ncbi:oligosaccharide repeat unit polymerase [Vibrio sp. Isolate34]|uniref:oligosaccharide repeat unit polymerase n=1 Tax=Vibrio sp. Isolate34 TaxID=2908540 RepID=UPI001EFC2EF7|nr:oligosaccharide repeat unit polymerase [Vibrio sp. Isolate34]MCG9639517.1 oligosaccharide repeat unit polymerase [Vibrio sp. Isolate34]